MPCTQLRSTLCPICTSGQYRAAAEIERSGGKAKNARMTAAEYRAARRSGQLTPTAVGVLFSLRLSPLLRSWCCWSLAIEQLAVSIMVPMIGAPLAGDT